jgi:hypothetical protein
MIRKVKLITVSLFPFGIPIIAPIAAAPTAARKIPRE